MRIVLLAALASCATTIGADGSAVTLRGRVSDKALQHFAQGVPGKVDAFFDYNTDDTILIYWTSAPACRGEIEIEGTVRVESGRSKGGSDMHMKSIDVHRARCLD